MRKITNKHKLTVANVFLFLILALNDVTEISSGEQLPSRKSKSVRAIFINTRRDGRLPVCRQPKRESFETDSFFFSFLMFLFPTREGKIVDGETIHLSRETCILSVPHLERRRESFSLPWRTVKHVRKSIRNCVNCV